MSGLFVDRERRLQMNEIEPKKNPRKGGNIYPCTLSQPEPVFVEVDKNALILDSDS